LDYDGHAHSPVSGLDERPSEQPRRVQKTFIFPIIVALSASRYIDGKHLHVRREIRTTEQTSGDD
jgi:hypothetical protein